MKNDMITMSESICVLEADELLVLCGNCGNRMTKMAMKQMLNAIPVSQKTVLNN